MSPIIFHPLARQEIDDAVARSANWGTTADFKLTLREVWAAIAADPRYAARIGRSQVREFVMTRFPYSAIYRETASGVYVVAFAHHKRKRGYWKSRLRRP